jgi:hypothetical protein
MEEQDCKDWDGERGWMDVSPSHRWLGKLSPYLVRLLTFQSSVDVIVESLGAILPF